ncbi:MAG: hypothetical protein UZ18_ATM001002515 [Armatimonadetes bacterium OLB18]|nr:MAG: hypothetical protein UZ18_ATM001002515 [Armatimonadetes bacterium OLB18]
MTHRHQSSRSLAEQTLPLGLRSRRFVRDRRRILWCNYGPLGLFLYRLDVTGLAFFYSHVFVSHPLVLRASKSNKPSSSPWANNRASTKLRNSPPFSKVLATWSARSMW